MTDGSQKLGSPKSVWETWLGRVISGACLITIFTVLSTQLICYVLSIDDASQQHMVMALTGGGSVAVMLKLTLTWNRRQPRKGVSNSSTNDTQEDTDRNT